MKKYILETEDIIFTLEFTGNIMLIRGDSGSGKTYICNLIRDLQANEFTQSKVKASIPLSDIVVVRSKLELAGALNVSGKLVIIDRYDMLVDDSNREEVLNFINKSRNIFILMYRGKETGFNVNTLNFVSIHYDTYKGKTWLRCTNAY